MSVISPALHVRHAHRKDIERVNEMYREEYGDGYPYPYSPGMNGRGARIVAELEGEVVAFARVTEHAGHTGTFELGGMIVDPAHRRGGIASLMTDLRIMNVQTLDGHVAVAEPICSLSTRASQRNIDKHGFVSVGILPCKYPDLKPELLGDQAESVSLAVKAIDRDEAFDDRKLYLLAEHESLVASLVPGAVNLDRECARMRDPFPGIVRHEPVRGPRTVGSTFVDVPANWPDARATSAAIERDGFVFCAFLPRFGRTASGATFDAVRFVRTSRRRVRFEHIHVIDALAPLRSYLEERLGG